jgi:hypothetical protein
MHSVTRTQAPVWNVGMRVRPRFSVRVLLVLVTAIVLLMGWSQYRRRTIREQCDGWKAKGYHFVIPAEWHDYVFQRKPTVGAIHNVDGDEFLATVKVIRLSNGSVVNYDTIVDGDHVEKLKKLGMVEYK